MPQKQSVRGGEWGVGGGVLQRGFVSPESSQIQPTETPVLANQTAKKEAPMPDSAHWAHFLLPLSL